MATFESQDSNILDAQAVNWRWIVYPIVTVVVLVVGGFAIYTYQQNERDQHEMDAREAYLQAKTPEAFVQVADQFPKTTQATFALLNAAELSFGQSDFSSAAKDYQRVIDDSSTDPVLKDSAELGLGSSLEAANKIDDSIRAYLAVGQRGNSSPFAPYAYNAAARLYEQKHDQENERRILTEAASLGGDSAFVQAAKSKLETLDMNAAPSLVVPSVGKTPAPAASPTQVGAPAAH